MNLAMTFAEAKAAKAILEQAVNDASDVMQKFPKGEMGLTPDAVKMTLEWQGAYQNYWRAHDQLADFNRNYVKQFKKELNAERVARYTNFVNAVEA
jgi:hypothetical protein